MTEKRPKNVPAIAECPETVIVEGDDIKCVASGESACVWLMGEALDEWNSLLKGTDANSRKSAAQLPRYFERFANGQRLGNEMFKSLGRVKTPGGNEVNVYEFKSYQFRIYGVIREINKVKAFVGTACDPKKQQNKADAATIKRAAERAKEID